MALSWVHSAMDCTGAGVYTNCPTVMVSFFILDTLAGMGYACTPKALIDAVVEDVNPVCQNMLVLPWVNITVLCSEFENTTNCWQVILGHDVFRVADVAVAARVPVKVRVCAPIVTVV